MKIEQIEKRNAAIIENGILWSQGLECEPLYPLDILILGDYAGVKIPACFNRFVESSSKNRIKVTGAEKTIFKTLDKLATALEKES